MPHSFFAEHETFDAANNGLHIAYIMAPEKAAITISMIGDNFLLFSFLYPIIEVTSSKVIIIA